MRGVELSALHTIEAAMDASDRKKHLTLPRLAYVVSSLACKSRTSYAFSAASTPMQKRSVQHQFTLPTLLSRLALLRQSTRRKREKRMNNKTIKVDNLARVEGEGALFVKIKNNRVADVKFRII